VPAPQVAASDEAEVRPRRRRRTRAEIDADNAARNAELFDQATVKSDAAE
jgi:hypothetical protein